MKKNSDITIAVLNSKGGASKSTVSFQVAAASFLNKNLPVELLEFDDENLDSETFTNSQIYCEQVKVGVGTDIDLVLRETFLEKDYENLVIDVGGNKTTTIFIDGLKKSRLYRKIDLFIIPMSGGRQDVKNAQRTYDLIKDFNIPILFALSRVRNLKRLAFQYNRFFLNFPNESYFVLTDSDAIDLSRDNMMSVFEIANDKHAKTGFEKELDKAFDTNDNLEIAKWSIILQVFDESEKYVTDILNPAFETIYSMIGVNNNGI